MSENGPCSVLVVEGPGGVIQPTLAGCRRPRLAIAAVPTMDEALPRIRQAAPDLVLVDLERADARGLGDLEALLGLTPTPAVVLITGREDEALADAAIARGAQDCVVRGQIHPGMLGRIARHAVQRQRLRSGMRSEIERLHRSEAHLRQTRSRLRAILGAVPLAVLQLDRRGRVLMSSRIPGFATNGVAVGARLADHLPLESGARLQWHLRQAVLHQTEQCIELIAPGAGGRRETWVVHLSPLVDRSGGPPSVTATFRDVTAERQLAERLAQSDRMATVGLLTAALTAEIDNPMTAVLANAQALQEALAPIAVAAPPGAPGRPATPAELDTDIPEMAADIAAGAARVQRIVADLHRYAEVTERFEVVIEPSRALRAALALARPRLGEALTITTRIEPTPPVRVDESRFIQVTAQLLMNAAQGMAHLPRGDQRVEVALRTVDGAAELSVRGPGGGAPDTEPAERSGSVRPGQAADGGAGIGLEIARRMVQSWGGRITVADVPEGGTISSVRLPAARASEAARTRRARARQGHAATPVPPRGRVVLVGPDPARRERLRIALSSDHQVTVVPDLEAARAALGTAAPTAAVLVDVADTARGIEDFDAWLRVHAPQLRGRVAWIAPASPTAEQRRILAGRTGHLLDPDAGAAALRRVIGRMLAA